MTSPSLASELGLLEAAVTLWPKSDWNLAAADLIVHEAGGCVTDRFGQRFRYNAESVSKPSLVCAGPALHGLLRQELANIATTKGNAMARKKAKKKPEKQLLHLVIGGELRDCEDIEFRNLEAVDYVGAFPNYNTAYDAWKAAAQRTVDNAHMRYFIIHAHRLLEPESDDDDHDYDCDNRPSHFDWSQDD